MTDVRGRDIGLLFLLGGIWGTSFVFIAAGLEHFDPFWFAAIRYDVAALVMLGFALATRVRPLFPETSRQWIAVVVSAALNVTAYHAFLFWGQQFTTAAIAAVVVSLNPMMATVVARALLPGERVGPFGVLGLLAGILGIIVLVGLKPGELLDARGIGELAVVGAVVSWAFGAVLVKRSKHGMAVVPFTVMQMLLGALMLHALSLVAEGVHPKTEFTAWSVTAVVYMAVVASALGFFIYFSLLERIGPIRSSLVSYLAPVVATTIGIIALHDPFEPRAVLAFVLIAAGFRLVILPARGATPPGDVAANTPPAAR